MGMNGEPCYYMYSMKKHNYELTQDRAHVAVCKYSLANSVGFPNSMYPSHIEKKHFLKKGL